MLGSTVPVAIKFPESDPGAPTVPPTLTVALPTYRGARHVGDALRGILAQRGADFNLLVFDDRSTDDTIDVVRAIAGDRARIEVNAERLGLAGNWNRCVERAETPLVAIVHQDDIIRPDHLATHREAFDRHPDLGFTAAAVEVIDADGRPIPPTVIERPDLGPIDRVFPPGGFVLELAARNPVRCSAVVLRAEALRAVGGFDPSFRYAVDWECWLRLARRFPIAWIARPTVDVRWHPESETHRFRRGTEDLDEVARLLDQIHSQDAALLPEPLRSRSKADAFLARALLNRSHLALRAGDGPLACRCLVRSLSTHPSILGVILREPRLALQMTALGLAPRLAASFLHRPSSDSPAELSEESQ